MTQVNLKECVIHPVIYAQSLMDRAEVAEARAAQTIAELRDERDSLSRQLREACNEVTDDVTRLQWLKSLIHEARCHIGVLSDGDLDAVMTCLREVEGLHDALKAILDGGAS